MGSFKCKDYSGLALFESRDFQFTLKCNVVWPWIDGFNQSHIFFFWPPLHVFADIDFSLEDLKIIEFLAGIIFIIDEKFLDGLNGVFSPA